MDKLSLSPRRSCPQKNLEFGHVTSQFYRDGEGITEKCILLTKSVAFSTFLPPGARLTFLLQSPLEFSKVPTEYRRIQKQYGKPRNSLQGWKDMSRERQGE